MRAKLSRGVGRGVAPVVRVARPDEVLGVLSVLREAAEWLVQRGEPLWSAEELTPATVVADVEAGRYVLAFLGGVAVGTLRFQLEDELFWPDASRSEAAYVHRLAVRRAHAGGAVSTALLDWAAVRTVALCRRFLRLDCDAARERLRAVYERREFVLHSTRTVGPYFVARYQKELRGSPYFVRALCTSPLGHVTIDDLRAATESSDFAMMAEQQRLDDEHGYEVERTLRFEGDAGDFSQARMFYRPRRSTWFVGVERLRGEMAAAIADRALCVLGARDGAGDHDERMRSIASRTVECIEFSMRRSDFDGMGGPIAFHTALPFAVRGKGLVVSNGEFWDPERVVRL